MSGYISQGMQTKNMLERGENKPCDLAYETKECKINIKQLTKGTSKETISGMYLTSSHALKSL